MRRLSALRNMGRNTRCIARPDGPDNSQPMMNNRAPTKFHIAAARPDIREASTKFYCPGAPSRSQVEVGQVYIRVWTRAAKSGNSSTPLPRCQSVVTSPKGPRACNPTTEKSEMRPVASNWQSRFIGLSNRGHRSRLDENRVAADVAAPLVPSSGRPTP